jgi:hypothetical protein
VTVPIDTLDTEAFVIEITKLTACGESGFRD